MFNITKHDTAILGGYIDGYWNEIEKFKDAQKFNAGRIS